MNFWTRPLVALFVFVCLFTTSPVHAADNTWSMAGANPQRTGWTPEEIPLDLKVKWVKPIAPYVSQRVQAIGAANKVFLATSKGLYAFDAGTGNQLWLYATEMPLGDAPTYDNGVLYVGGLDKRVHAINAETGQKIWTFTAEAGFTSNPLVMNGVVYIGGRDGYFYGLNASNGQKVFSYNAGSQILQSPAYNNGKIFFTSLDGFAYALNSTSGALVWKSAKLPGMGFHSWWPVVYQDKIILTRGRFEGGLRNTENNWLFTDKTTGLLPGDMLSSSLWLGGHPTIDIKNNPNGNTIPDYLETYPSRQNAIFLDQNTGSKVTFDLDQDSKEDGAPLLWTGGSGQLAPPIVSGYDNRLYFRTVDYASAAIPGAMAVGWDYQTSKLSYPVSNWAGASPDWPSDEQTGLSAAGSKIYWNLCCDRNAGAADLSKPNTAFPDKDATRQARYMNGSANPPEKFYLPTGYHEQAIQYYWHPPTPAVYWSHTDNQGPMIYNGKMYLIRSNALIAFSADGAGATAPVLQAASAPTVPGQTYTTTTTALKAKLEQEISKVVTAGHLKPSFLKTGLLNTFGVSKLDDNLLDYWHNAADIHYFLLRAYPQVSSSLQSQIKTYLQQEFATFSPMTYSHVGYTTGTQRDPYIYPPYDQSLFNEPYLPAQTNSSAFSGWSFPPHNVYAVYQYAKFGLGNASSLYTTAQSKLKAPITANKAGLTDAYLASFPHVHNAYIAGYYGMVELAKLAGQSATAYAPYQNELNRLLALRVQNFTTFPTPNTGDAQADSYFYTNIGAWNFMYMTPELATHLKTNASAKVASTLTTYQHIAPYWSASHNLDIQGENAILPYQMTHSMFQARAKIMGDSMNVLAEYLDAPIVPVGDLYYIDNLVSALEAGGGAPPPSGTPAPSPSSVPSPSPSAPPTCTPSAGDLDASGKVTLLDLAKIVTLFGSSGPQGDLNCDQTVNSKDIAVLLSSL